jgi:K+/H+ antiporter YhaU regulatory subunit KhtT
MYLFVCFFCFCLKLSLKIGFLSSFVFSFDKYMQEVLSNKIGLQKGLSIVRAIITDQSRLVGRNIIGKEFRDIYKAEIVAVQRKGNNITEQISTTTFMAGDVLFLQVGFDSFLLQQPQTNFQSSSTTSSSILGGSALERSSVASGVGTDHYGSIETTNREEVWRDLQVASAAEGTTTMREYLTAMKIPEHSPHVKKSAFEAGLTKLPGMVLVSVERPSQSPAGARVVSGAGAVHSLSYVETYNDNKVESVPFDHPLAEGDVLWFSGSVIDVAGSLRKVPGLVSYEMEQVEKLKGHLHERRLVQAVIAMRSPLIGQTPKEARFRTRFGAAVIAVNRGRKRLYEYPGNVKLRGIVL